MAQPSAASRWSWLLLILAFGLLCVANGRWIVAPAAWLAPVALLIFIDSRSARNGLGWAGLVQLLAYFVNWRGMIPVPGLWYYLVAGIYAGVYFLPFVLQRLVAPRLGGFRSTLVLPVSWVAIEFLFQKFVTPYGSWASLAYTQAEFLPLIQLASVTGSSGIHFVMLWFAAIAAWAWRQGRPFARVRGGVVAFGAVCVVLLIWGQWRVLSAPVHAPALRVATVTSSASLTRDLQREMASLIGPSSVDASSLEASSAIASRINDDLLERTRRQIESGAELVVWSEHAARVTRQTEARLIERGQSLARSAGVILILGIGLWDPDSRPAFENKLVMIASDGTISGVYHKARPIVGQESGQISEGNAHIATMETGRGRLGIAICHDLDFPDLVREAGRLGVDVLLGPSSDWQAIESLHAKMAIPRAVENGCSLVRPCSNGLSLIVDPLGRTIAAQRDQGERGNVLVADVPLYHLRTAYPVVGDTFAYGNLLALVLILAAHFRASLRRRSAGQGAAT